MPYKERRISDAGVRQTTDRPLAPEVLLPRRRSNYFFAMLLSSAAADAIGPDNPDNYEKYFLYFNNLARRLNSLALTP